ncbi:hypothetical protein [Tenacibaculum phage JQ]|nr:hypothetical protein [Tenacibaculum phage JQ]
MNQEYYTYINDLEFRRVLTEKVKKSKAKRQETQAEVSKWLEIPLTKIKQIENGTCKDINAILNYINYFDEHIFKMD